MKTEVYIDCRTYINGESYEKYYGKGYLIEEDGDTFLYTEENVLLPGCDEFYTTFYSKDNKKWESYNEN